MVDNFINMFFHVCSNVHVNMDHWEGNPNDSHRDLTIQGSLDNNNTF